MKPFALFMLAVLMALLIANRFRQQSPIAVLSRYPKTPYFTWVVSAISHEFLFDVATAESQRTRSLREAGRTDGGALAEASGSFNRNWCEIALSSAAKEKRQSSSVEAGVK